MAQRMACIVLVEIHKEMDRPSVADLARTVEMKNPAGLMFPDVEKTVDAMLDHASRYKNIEAALGKGVCLVLGCHLSES